MDTNVQALKNLYATLGGNPADVVEISTNAEMIDAIAALDIGGGGGTVDQTYNPTSENAQSGIAVAQAIANVPKLISIGTINSVNMGTVAEQAITTSEPIRDYEFYVVNLQVTTTMGSVEPVTDTVTITIPIATGYSAKSLYELRIGDTHICDVRIRLSGSNNSSVQINYYVSSTNASMSLEIFKLG